MSDTRPARCASAMYGPVICHAAGARSVLLEIEYRCVVPSADNRKWPGQSIEIADHGCTPRAGFFFTWHCALQVPRSRARRNDGRERSVVRTDDDHALGQRGLGEEQACVSIGCGFAPSHEIDRGYKHQGGDRTDRYHQDGREREMEGLVERKSHRSVDDSVGRYRAKKLSQLIGGNRCGAGRMSKPIIQNRTKHGCTKRAAEVTGEEV